MITIETYSADVLAAVYDGMKPDEICDFVLEFGEADPEPLEYESEAEAVDDWNDTGLYVGRSEVIGDGNAYRLTCNAMYKNDKLLMVSDFDYGHMGTEE